MKILYGSNFIGQADSSGNAGQKPVESYEGFQPESMGLNLEERNSTATITLSPEQPQMTVGMWLRDDTEPGLGMVWRVKTVNEQYDRRTVTATLEHISATLKDLLIFGEVNWKIMAGSASATGCTPRQAVNYICNQTGGLWALAEIAEEYENVSLPYVFNGDTLFAALETVAGSLQDSYLEFGTDSIPFYVAIRKADSTVAAEMRLNRNIQSIRKTIDRSKMFTRFYPIGQKDLHYIGPNSEPYMSRNENVYGIISKVATDQTITTQAGLAAWATEQLQRHADPSVTVQISGVDLGRATGEPLDWVEINKRCRVPLPEFNTVITEKVTKISWPDKVKEKDRFTVTLANELQDVAKILNNANKAAGKSGRSQAKKEKEDTEWFVDVELQHLLVRAKKSGDNLQLWELADNDKYPNNPTITFNKAVVTTTAKGTWDGGSFTVSAASSGSGGVNLPIATTIGLKDATWGNNDGICTVSIGYEDPLSGNIVATGCTFTITDSNLMPGNIKSGVTVCGVTGQYSQQSAYNDGWDNAVAAIGNMWTSSENPQELPEHKIGYGAMWRVGVTYKDHNQGSHSKSFVVRCPSFWIYPYSGASEAGAGTLPAGQKVKLSDGENGMPIAIWWVPEGVLRGPWSAAPSGYTVQSPLAANSYYGLNGLCWKTPSGACHHTYLSAFYCTISQGSDGRKTLTLSHTYSVTETPPNWDGQTHDIYY